MRYSNILGIVACLALVTLCFTPWVYIATIQTTVTGFHTPHTNFGKPGLVHCILAGLAVLCFAISHTGAKRTNIFICTLNLAWAFRNYILTTRCEVGECPEKRWAIYFVVLTALFMLVMSLLPYSKATVASQSQ